MPAVGVRRREAGPIGSSGTADQWPRTLVDPALADWTGRVGVVDHDRVVPDDDIVTSGYDAFYEALPGNETFRRIWARHACGSDFPAGFDHISFLTGPEIDAVLEYLRLPPNATLVDVACGAGGPGLWLAQRSGASLLGVDLSSAGLDWARRRSQSVTMAGSATFIEGSFATTGLASSLADGLVSFDALHYVPDKSATFSEAARVLRPRGRMVFTAFEVEPELVLDLPCSVRTLPRTSDQLSSERGSRSTRRHSDGGSVSRPHTRPSWMLRTCYPRSWAFKPSSPSRAR